jgi:hypothetical protein
VLHDGRRHREGAGRPGPVGLEVDDVEREGPLHSRRAGKEDLHRLGHPAGRAGRAGDDERPPALADELGVEDEERHAAEVVAVEVRQHDRVDGARVEAEPPEPDEHRGAAVDQDAAAAALDQEAGLEPAPAAEGVAAADEGHAHAVRSQLVDRLTPPPNRRMVPVRIRRSCQPAFGPVKERCRP